jgi:hypothetical protein
MTGIPEYFGHGVIGATYIDPDTDTGEPKNRWRWYCEIDEYEPFSDPVPFKDEEQYIEDIPSNFWGVAVRELPESAYRKILDLAGRGQSGPNAKDFQQALNLPLLEDVDISINSGQSALVIPQSGSSGGASGSGARRSRYSKAIGDQGERIVIRFLRETLPTRVASTLRWVADEGETPGWDIEYTENRETFGVEVKATTGSAFPSVEITANEWQAAEKLGGRYRLALVVNVCSKNPRIEFLDNPWSLAESGQLSTTPLTWKIQRNSKP